MRLPLLYASTQPSRHIKVLIIMLVSIENRVNRSFIDLLKIFEIKNLKLIILAKNQLCKVLLQENGWV